MCLGKLLWRLDESLVTVLILQPCGYWGLWGQSWQKLSLTVTV